MTTQPFPNTDNPQPFPPAPWSIQTLNEQHNGYEHWKTFAIRAPNNVCLAVVGDVDRFYENHYDKIAQLMATAPDLAAALILATATIERLAPTHKGGFSSAKGTLDVAEAALKKAGVL